MPDGGETVETIFGRFGGFAVGQYTDTDRDKTTLENGYDAELKGVMLGFDYRFSDKLTAGVAVSFNDEDADFNADSGHLKTDSWNVTVYGNFAPLKNMYIDAYAGYSNIDYESTRTIIFGALRGTARGTTDGDQFIAGFTAGNDWNFGAFTVGPQLIMDYSTTSIDGYGEKGGVDPLMLLNYGDQTIHSLTTNLGGQASYSQSFSWGVLVPNARLYWVHEYKDGSRRLPKSMSLDSTRSFTVKTDSPDRDYMVFGGGVSTVLPHGVQLFADYDTTFSHEFLHTWTATVGFRKAF